MKEVYVKCTDKLQEISNRASQVVNKDDNFDHFDGYAASMAHGIGQQIAISRVTRSKNQSSVVNSGFLKKIPDFLVNIKLMSLCEKTKLISGIFSCAYTLHCVCI